MAIAKSPATRFRWQRLEARPIATMTLEAQERHEKIEKISRDD
jgi:RNA polymerase-binding transcription factor DksA